MLPLDDERWATLWHAYGRASDIPPKLRLLETELRQSADESSPSHLWRDLDLANVLLHSGDVSPAAYAAAPYLIELATLASPALRVEILFVAAVIIAESTHQHTPILDFLRPGLDAAMTRAAQLIVETMLQGIEDNMLCQLILALAYVQGRMNLVPVLESLAEKFDWRGGDDKWRVDDR